MRVFKEIAIMLGICLAGILLCALAFYEYIPNRKVVPDVIKYEASGQVSEQLADNVNHERDQVLKTYEVTSVDLTNYKTEKEYVPGKANPFASVKENIEATATENPSENVDANSSDKSSSESKSNSKSSNGGKTSVDKSNSSDETQSEYIRDKGTK